MAIDCNACINLAELLVRPNDVDIESPNHASIVTSSQLNITYYNLLLPIIIMQRGEAM